MITKTKFCKKIRWHSIHFVDHDSSRFSLLRQSLGEVIDEYRCEAQSSVFFSYMQCSHKSTRTPVKEKYISMWGMHLPNYRTNLVHQAINSLESLLKIPRLILYFISDSRNSSDPSWREYHKLFTVVASAISRGRTSYPSGQLERVAKDNLRHWSVGNHLIY